MKKKINKNYDQQQFYLLIDVIFANYNEWFRLIKNVIFILLNFINGCPKV